MNELDDGVLYTEVISTNVHSIGYNPETLTLFVKFKDKKTAGWKGRYWYKDVVERVYRDFLESGSKGKFFDSTIKGHYEYGKF